MQQLKIASDGQFPTYAINYAGNGDIFVCNLTADTATSLAVPSGARIAIFGFSSANDYWVGTSTFSIPSSGTFAASNIYLNPPPLVIGSGVSTLWFRSPSSCTVSVAFYS